MSNECVRGGQYAAALLLLCIILVLAFCFACFADGKCLSAVPVAHMLGTGCQAQVNSHSAHGAVKLNLGLATVSCPPVLELCTCSTA